MVRIRKAEKEDIDELIKIEKECFSMPWSKKSFLDALYMDNTLFLVAELTNERIGAQVSESKMIAGYCGLYQSLEEGEITNVAVGTKCRRQQIASRLLEEMLRQARNRGICKIFLEVRVSNVPAIRLYQKHGFIVCGCRKGFYEKPREDAWLMVWEENRC